VTGRLGLSDWRHSATCKGHGLYVFVPIAVPFETRRLFTRTTGSLMECSAMTIKCDYCRGSLGLNAHRYWRMRYCSVECVTAYQRRLDEGTVGKIRCLESRLVAKEAA
jgi:hypothetical protein